jgi:hypothetical protein
VHHGVVAVTGRDSRDESNQRRGMRERKRKCDLPVTHFSSVTLIDSLNHQAGGKKKFEQQAKKTTRKKMKNQA